MENVYTVIKVERCPWVNVTGYQSGAEVKLAASLFEDVKARVPASLKLSESVSDGERLYKSELTFRTRSELPKVGSLKTYCYRITISNGVQYLMGTGVSTHPRPVTTMSRTMGAVTSNQMPDYKVVLTDVMPLPVIV